MNSPHPFRTPTREHLAEPHKAESWTTSLLVERDYSYPSPRRRRALSSHHARVPSAGLRYWQCEYGFLAPGLGTEGKGHRGWNLDPSLLDPWGTREDRLQDPCSYCRRNISGAAGAFRGNHYHGHHCFRGISLPQRVQDPHSPHSQSPMCRRVNQVRPQPTIALTNR